MEVSERVFHRGRIHPGAPTFDSATFDRDGTRMDTVFTATGWVAKSRSAHQWSSWTARRPLSHPLHAANRADRTMPLFEYAPGHAARFFPLSACFASEAKASLNLAYGTSSTRSSFRAVARRHEDSLDVAGSTRAGDEADEARVAVSVLRRERFVAA